MSSFTYAEQILDEKKCNQWFLLYHNQNENWKPHIQQQHEQFLNAHLVPYTLVAGMGETVPLGNLYHVQFDGATDPRLTEYMRIFEDEQGNSLQPDQYQMLEWSYDSWVEHGGPQEFFAWLQQTVT